MVDAKVKFVISVSNSAWGHRRSWPITARTHSGAEDNSVSSRQSDSAGWWELHFRGIERESEGPWLDPWLWSARIHPRLKAFKQMETGFLRQRAYRCQPNSLNRVRDIKGKK